MADGVEKVLAVVSAIIGILVLAGGIWGVFIVIDDNFVFWQGLVYSCYLIFFGGMVVFLEFKGSSKLLEWFGFMRNFAGKGLFFIFLGMFCFGVELSSYYFTYGLSGIVICFGILLVIYYYAAHKNVHYDIIA